MSAEDPVETVRNFCAMWDHGMDRVREAVGRYFTPETVWDNVGWSLTHGPAEALSLWETFGSMGIFEIADGKISSWRDYTDPAVMAALPRPN